jgi:hypothetical protein
VRPLENGVWYVVASQVHHSLYNVPIIISIISSFFTGFIGTFLLEPVVNPTTQASSF